MRGAWNCVGHVGTACVIEFLHSFGMRTIGAVRTQSAMHAGFTIRFQDLMPNLSRTDVIESAAFVST